MSDKTDQELIEILHKNGLKATPQRLAICKYILQSKEHPTADKIYRDIKKEYKTIGQATVYKTLALLKKLGLISELSFDNNHSRFDPNREIHINIICPKCDSIHDYESNTINDFWMKIKAEIGGEFTGQRLDLYKLCKKCQ
jgi:Fur family peroxide stress response transcriptional regulator